MRRIITTISAIVIGAFLISPVADAQGRHGRHGDNGRSHGQHTETPSRRPGNSGGQRPDNRPGNRPGNRPDNRPDNRPGGNNHGGNGFRPGGDHGHKPDNRPGYRPDHRPDHRPGNGFRPGTPPPGHNHGHVHRPPHRPPYRPYMPAHRPWHRPVPPPHFRPAYGAPTFAGVLGLVFGTALDITLNNLINSGYSVSGYGNDCVYLSNVRIMDFSWPEATLNYIGGNLRGSEFTYSTPFYDMSRYNMLYRNLANRYGPPVAVDGTTVTWWGYNNGYVRLSYFNDYAYNGASRYYTTLSIGN